MNDASSSAVPSIDFNTPKLMRNRRFRRLKDKLAKHLISVGGMSVIVAITLIFFYLLYEVLPLFDSAQIERVASYQVPAASAGKTLFVALEEQGEVALRVSDGGQAVFFKAADGNVLRTVELPLPEGAQLTSVEPAGPASTLLAAALDNGGVLLFEQSYAVTFPNDQRVITPSIEFPYGEQVLTLMSEPEPITRLVVKDSSHALMIAVVDERNQMFARQFEKQTNFLTGEVSLTPHDVALPRLQEPVLDLELEPNLRWLYVAMAGGFIEVYDLSNSAIPKLNNRVSVTQKHAEIAAIQLLIGGASLMVTDDRGGISQWFMVRDEQNSYAFTKIRSFEHASLGLTSIVAEQRRKGFLVGDQLGYVSIYNATAHRQLLSEQVTGGPITQLAVAPRANFMLFEDGDQHLQFWSVRNEYPDVSWAVLWDKVWYEGYPQPDYVWQSSASNSDFEPKYSLMPLVFGTLKAAFYSMLLATPLAICGAIYTAYFMAPALRRKVKPSIELMQALPTVILGFLAGLFFAPFMEQHLPGVFTWLLIMPLAILVFGFVWNNLPQKFRHWVPTGWAPLWLLPWVVFVTWVCFSSSAAVEGMLFQGDMRNWLTDEIGLGFDQRNALVVGVAMGFAVIPTIFSITEDAIFSVPKHLTLGSLALGATTWQTLVRVVLPTASPGLFSGVMIGMGRAVGETMIVLMATGNTPIMDANIFEGMRTLAANIAVEMPETEVGSSHYHILFLTAFVLFAFTFIVNTVAEFVRQRLRAQYSVI